MIVRLVSATSMQVVEVEQVSQIVVMTDRGQPCVAAHDTADGTVVASHAAEADFPSMLRQLGIKPPEIVKA